MSYEDCGKVVDAVRPLLKGTAYGIEYYLDGNPYFTLNGEYFDFDDFPVELQSEIDAVLTELNVEF